MIYTITTSELFDKYFKFDGQNITAISDINSYERKEYIWKQGTETLIFIPELDFTYINLDFALRKDDKLVPIFSFNYVEDNNEVDEGYEAIQDSYDALWEHLLKLGGAE